MISVKDVEQLSPEWFKLRAGKPSASNFKKIVGTKGEASKQRKPYMYELAGESYTGKKAESFNLKQFERGIELEKEARDYLALSEGLDFEEVGLVYPDERKLYSCSPDGLLPDRGLEIKCPYLGTHTSYLLGQKLPTEYIVQVQGSMLVTGLRLWEFMSYHPDMPAFRITVVRDDNFCEILRHHLNKFCIELSDMKASLASICNG